MNREEAIRLCRSLLEVLEAETEPKAKAFRKPTVDEVRVYCLGRMNSVDPQAFVDHYESKGWKVGKTPMKDWQAAVRTWEQKDRQRAPTESYTVSTEDYSKLEALSRRPPPQYIGEPDDCLAKS